MKNHQLRLISAALTALSFSTALSAEPKTRIVPPAGVERTSTVGSTIWQADTYKPIRGIVIAFEVELRGHLFRTENPLQRVSSPSGVKACILVNGYPFGECLVDDNSDGKFDRIDGKRYLLDAPVPYIEGEIADPQIGTFSETYTYSGNNADSLHLTFKQFTPKYARAVFSEELTIPLGKSFPQQVAFKNVRMTILSIDGMGLRYRIEK